MTSISLARDAKIIVDGALTCETSELVYADLLRAYIAAPSGGRDALFLEIAHRFATTAGQGQAAKQTTAFPRSADQRDDACERAELLQLARLVLALLQRQTPQEQG